MSEKLRYMAACSAPTPVWAVTRVMTHTFILGRCHGQGIACELGI